MRRLTFASLTVAGVLSTTLFAGLGMGTGYADPPPGDPAAPQEDPPPPPSPSFWLSGQPNIYQPFPTWPAAFPKCWPPWEPPGAPTPPPGDVRLGYFNYWTAPYTPCPAPPPLPDGQAYTQFPEPPPPFPPCGWGTWPVVCFPGQEQGGPLPAGYYGPPSWYPN